MAINISAPKLGRSQSKRQSFQKMEDSNRKKPEGNDKKDTELPSGLRLTALVISTCVAMFVSALDLTIMSVAIPRITQEFHSSNDIGWYGSAYFLTTCAFQLSWGKLYTLYNLKWMYIASITIFEIGSLVAGVSPNSNALIAGRAIQGLGSAGVISGSNTVIAFSTPLEKRPLYSSILGSVYGVSSVVGPLLGGVLTSKATWRWCFYINIPFGAVAIGGILLFFRAPSIADPAARNLSAWNKVKRLDPLSTIVFVGSVACLLLALEWGGTTYPWSSGRIIALMVVFGLSLASWIAIQVYRGDKALIPGRIAKQRSMIFAQFYNFTTGGAYFLMLYYVEIWFQSVRSVSPVHAGIDTLPMILAVTVGTMGTAFIVTKIGYYAPFPIISAVFMSIGAGLTTTWSPQTSHQNWIGYQIIFGLGVGIGWQQGLIVAQNVFTKKDVPLGIALASSWKLFGGAIFESVGENVFTNKLVQNLPGDAPGVDPKQVLLAGSAGIEQNVPHGSLRGVLKAYNGALTTTFIITTALSAISMLGAVGFEWISVKRNKPQQPKKEEVQEREVRFAEAATQTDADVEKSLPPLPEDGELSFYASENSEETLISRVPSRPPTVVTRMESGRLAPSVDRQLRRDHNIRLSGLRTSWYGGSQRSNRSSRYTDDDDARRADRRTESAPVIDLDVYQQMLNYLSILLWLDLPTRDTEEYLALTFLMDSFSDSAQAQFYETRGDEPWYTAREQEFYAAPLAIDATSNLNRRTIIYQSSEQTCTELYQRARNGMSTRDGVRAWGLYDEFEELMRQAVEA